MKSEERRAGRRKRREAAREAKKAQRNKEITFNNMCSLNTLYKAQRQAARGVGWKASTQRYQINWLLNINKTANDLGAGREVCKGFHEFDISDRGHARHISSVHFSERVPQKALSQNILIPSLKPSLIERNSANIKGRGVSFALRMLKRDLVRHYQRYGNEGYILLADYRDYFASIEHEAVKAMLCKYIADARALDLALHFIDVQGVRGLGLGCEPNQIEAVSLPNPVDHFACEMLELETYARYMDDSYAIHIDKEYLRACDYVLRDKAAQLGIEVSDRKTHVCKLSKGFEFLKKRIFYSKTGAVIMRPSRRAITTTRRKTVKHSHMVDAGIMTEEQAYQSFQSMIGSWAGLNAYGATGRAIDLYNRLHL
ncbi:MAG: hypothetical protein Q4C41_03485 [Eggerthellaceae bacterium]|nr:hypothetical protein [Eggerthellaceae bacterium]